MSPREAWPRPWRRHEQKAAEVLRAYAQLAGWTPALPIPIELVIERLFGLRISHAVLSEPPGTKILGALDPAARTIYLNEAHQDMFDTWVGPERFTLAHELGHWLYDADDPDQMSLLTAPEQIFCRGAQTGLDDVERIRERNADGFAAHVLMPADLVRRALGMAGWPSVDVRGLAEAWGVSRTALAIRLEQLGMVGRTR